MRKINSKITRETVKKIEHFNLRVERYFKMGLKDRDTHLKIFVLLPLLLSYLLISYTYNSLTDLVPLWQTKPWGENILSAKLNLYIIPLVLTLFTAVAFLLSYLAKKFYFTYLSQILLAGGAILNFIALLNIWSIVTTFSITPVKFVSLSPLTQNLVSLFIMGFITSNLILPKFILWTKKHNIVTDPNLHHHPAMILTKPSSRGGGFAFSIVLTILSILLLEKTPFVLGTIGAVLTAGIIGILDDYQNTHPKSKLKALENPALRLLALLPLPVIFMMAFGIVSYSINNPFDGYINLSDFSFRLGQILMTPFPYLFTLIWTIAIMNMISWSNGVDGQFAGIAGISLFMVGILSLRLVGTEPLQTNTAKLAFLASGTALGFIKHTWHPSKIMWGFGAISIGILLSSLSIMSRAKVATAIMVILIPFLDGFITIVRRIFQKKNPLKGDRGHLHHLLLARGWSPQKVAIFYWLGTAVFGIIGLASADKSTALVTLTFGGIVASFIIILNVSSRVSKNGQNSAHSSKEAQIDTKA